jgi:tRNA(Ile)-lysidine synthase
MHLQGMSGRKKLQDLFVDLKVPRRLRDSVPIVVSPQGIVWVAGYRVASQCAADPATTSCLQLDLVGE